jgi:long-chain acyl-CoA synthetase
MTFENLCIKIYLFNKKKANLKEQIKNKMKTNIKNKKEEKYFDAQKFRTIRDLIKHSADVYGSNIAFTIKNKNKDTKEVSYINITYKDLLSDINSLGTALSNIGFKNKRIAVIGKNRYEWIITHYSNVMGSNVSIPLDKDLQLEELENSLVRSEADAIVFDKKQEPMIAEIKKKMLIMKIRHIQCS